MTRKICVLAVLLCLAPATALAASDGGTTVCERTAGQMYTACQFDVDDEFNEALAICRNLATRHERISCRRNARVERREYVRECDDVLEARQDVCELLGENRYAPDPLTGVAQNGDPINFVDPDTIGGATPPNPYFSLVPGKTSVFRAGEDFDETIVVHVTPQTRRIRGVDCRVVVDVVLVDDDGELVAVEVTDDWYAQADNGDVYYCGELSRNFEDGVLRDLDGSFESGYEGAQAGLLIRAAPVVGDAHRQEYALGEAEDVVQYASLNAVPGADQGGDHPDSDFGCAAHGGCVQTEEFVPLEPDSGEFKYYVDGIGFVLGVALEDGEPSGERDEIVCTGNALAVLKKKTCGIDDPKALRAELCRLAPDAFCN